MKTGMTIRPLLVPRVVIERDGWKWRAWACHSSWSFFEPGSIEQGGILRINAGRAWTPWGARRLGWRRMRQIRVIENP